MQGLSMEKATAIASDADNCSVLGRRYVCASVLHMLALHGFRSVRVPDDHKLVAAWLFTKHGVEVRA